MEHTETLVVGGGQAGLALSWHLRARGREHLILERGRLAERWRAQRWDSLCFQSPNWSLELPGYRYGGPDPEAFAHKDELVRLLESYAASIAAPMREGVEVVSVRPSASGDRYRVSTRSGEYEARNVVVATGPYQRPRIPSISAGLPRNLFQVHAADYRNPSQLPPGGVLVVGSGTSGCQIGEELLRSGRRVFLAVGRHSRVPRRYRGRDVFWWRRELGYLDRRAADAPRAARAAPPLITGVDGGHDVDLRSYFRAGMALLGRLVDAREGRIAVADDLERNLSAGDRAYVEFLDEVDRFCAAKEGLPPPPPRPPLCLPAPRSPEVVDLAAAGIQTIVWATGYSMDFGWVGVPVFDPGGEPLHDRGVTSVRGLYFLGLPWLHTFKSSFLFGVGEDAEHLAEHICGAVRELTPRPHPTPA